MFTAAQVFMALALAPGHRGQVPAPLQAFPPSELKTRFLQLNNWDSQHYRDIARRGYQLPVDLPPGLSSLERRERVALISSDEIHADKANVGFFPAFPILGRWLASATGLEIESALIGVALFFSALSWLYFFLLLELFSEGEGVVLSVRTHVSWGVLLLAWPTQFFLVCGYSESLFMAALLGMIYWTERALREASKRAAGLCWLLAGVHGFALSASRLLGIPLGIYPFARTVLSAPSTMTENNLRKGAKKWERLGCGALTTGVALAGAGSFFAYCHFRFGIWNLYILLQQKGWHNLPDYLALFNPTSYLPYFFFEDTMDSISRTSIPVSLGALLAVGLSDYWRSKFDSFLARLPLYGVAFLLFYINLSGKANAHMDSMSRYTLPVYALTLLGWAWMRSDRLGFRWSWRSRAGVAFGLALQLYMNFMFLRGHWVA